MRYNVTRENIINMLENQAVRNRNDYDMRNSTHRILQNSSLSDIERMATDEKSNFFIASSKRDVPIQKDDFNHLQELEQLVWEEMLENGKIMKKELMGVGLTVTPMLGQYKYSELDKVTFEMSMMIPLTPAYTGYRKDLTKLTTGLTETPEWLLDFGELAKAVCELLDQETVLMKSVYFMEKMPIFLIDRNGKNVLVLASELEI